MKVDINQEKENNVNLEFMGILMLRLKQGFMLKNFTYC